MSELAPITLTYTNYRGETSERTITPQWIWYGSTEFHPETQWLIRAFDHEKQAVRDFAFKDFGKQATPTTEPRLDGLPVNCQHITVHVPDNHDATKPIPLRLRADYENPNCFATADGKRLFVEIEWAEKSMLMDSAEYKAQSHRTMLARRIVNAEIVENYSGFITCTGDEDDYFDSVEALIERYTDRAHWGKPAGENPTEEEIRQAIPSWAYCTSEEVFNFDIFDEIDSYLTDNHHENAWDFIKDTKRLERFWKLWSAKQTGLITYFIDYNRIVIIDQTRFASELAQAKATMEAAA